MIILLGGEKGGTGKSTIATNLAAWLARQGADVLLVDADRQRTASRWADRRAELEGVPEVHAVQKHGNVFHALKDLEKRYETVVVDAGGRDSEELRTALVACHRLYCPLRPSQADLETSVHMSELVKLAGGMNPALKPYVMLSMAPTHAAVTETDEAREVLVDLPGFRQSEAVIRERKIYRDAMAAGLGVMEMDNLKAQAEIERLVREIFGE